VNWSDGKQHERQGLDLRGANLEGADLNSLPLANTLAGLTLEEWYSTPPEQREKAIVHLARAHLGAAHLEGSLLSYARLDGAFLRAVHLEQAHLRAVHLEGANLVQAHVEGADLQRVFLDPVTNLLGVSLTEAKYGCARLADVRWGSANLAVIDWAQVDMLGDERIARKRGTTDGLWMPEPSATFVSDPTTPHANDMMQRLDVLRAAVRANRQLATVLRNQGLSEEASRFALRAQVLQRRVWRRQGIRKLPVYMGSLLLDLISGYGYRPLRSLISYVVVVLAFAGAYLVLAPSANLNLTPAGAIVTSMVSFHGRGFFPGQPSVDGVFMRFVAAEALCGLLLEITFIATFTQRFFAR
jgi:hypothetical protein